jgi:hypothetical protein
MIIGYFGTFDDFMILMNVFMNVSWVFVWLSKLFVVEYYLELKVKKKKKEKEKKGGLDCLTW